MTTDAGESPAMVAKALRTREALLASARALGLRPREAAVLAPADELTSGSRLIFAPSPARAQTDTSASSISRMHAAVTVGAPRPAANGVPSDVAAALMNRNAALLQAAALAETHAPVLPADVTPEAVLRPTCMRLQPPQPVPLLRSYPPPARQQHEVEQGCLTHRPQLQPSQSHSLLGVPLRLELCSAPDSHLRFVGRCCRHEGWPEFIAGEVLARWPDAEICVGDRSMIFFPASNYDAVEANLQVLAERYGMRVEPLPAWVRRVAGLVTQSTVPALGLSRAEAGRRARKAVARLPFALFEYQVEGVAFGLHRGGRVLIGDEMGLGKTVQALVLASQFESEWPLLIVSPSSLRYAWRDQAAQWLPGLVGESAELAHVVTSGRDKLPATARVIIVSYDLLRRFHFLRVRPDGRDYLAVIVDESQNIKDAASQRSKVVVGICKSARRVVLLSGTPAVNRAAELYTQLEALLPTEMPCFQTFAERYCVLQTQRFGRRVVERWGGVSRATELHALLTASVMIRRLKKMVLQQLPSKRRMRIPLNPELMDQDVLREVIPQVRRLGASSDTFLFNGNSSRGASGEIQVADLFRRTAEAKMGAVCDHVEHLLRSGTKFLLFGHHHQTLDRLELCFRKMNVAWVRIDGSTPPQKRPLLVAQFQEDERVRVALLSITAAGVGLTLTAAHIVVFAELYWVPGQMQQAEDRAHRIGQQDSVSVQYLVAKDTLDDIVFRALEKKARDTVSILDGGDAGSLEAEQMDGDSKSFPGQHAEGDARRMRAEAVEVGHEGNEITPIAKRPRLHN